METFSGLAMDIALSFVMMKPLVLSMIVPLIPICVLTVSLSLLPQLMVVSVQLMGIPILVT